MKKENTLSQVLKLSAVAVVGVSVLRIFQVTLGNIFAPLYIPGDILQFSLASF